ncbi:MAG: hypothetical protein V4805_12875 [Pseudomonadota bacterium]
MDQQKLRNLVFEKTGIKVDLDDPIFALVALNEAVLAEAVGVHITAMDDATERLSVRTRQLQDVANQIRQGQTLQASPSLNADEWEAEAALPPAPVRPAPAGNDASGAKSAATSPAFVPLQASGWRAIAVVAAISLFSAAAALLGQSLLGRNTVAVPTGAAPAVLATPPALSAEQLRLIQSGENFAKLLPKLDEKTRAKVLAEMQK